MSYVVPAEGLTSLSAAELAEKIHSREVTSREVVQAHLDRIAETNDALNSFLHVGAEEALATADAVDKALDAGEKPASALAGVPLALKDLLTTTDAPTTAASKMLEGWISPYDATVTKKLRDAGIPILGKTNLDEFAMGSSNENSAYGPVHNPHDLERTPGGSGGGTSAGNRFFLYQRDHAGNLRPSEPDWAGNGGKRGFLRDERRRQCSILQSAPGICHGRGHWNGEKGKRGGGPGGGYCIFHYARGHQRHD